jgi:hypothetical protein
MAASRNNHLRRAGMTDVGGVESDFGSSAEGALREGADAIGFLFFFGFTPHSLAGSLSQNERKAYVAQICNLPYRRIAFCIAWQARTRSNNPTASQNSILRYSRLQICATCQGTETRRNSAPGPITRFVGFSVPMVVHVIG